LPALVGEIRIFAGNFAPAGWEFCHGQLMPISENEPLYNLIGTTYGGDGQSTFALPDLQGRVPIHMSNNNQIGEKAGVETVTLTQQQLPVHHHVVGGQIFMPSWGANPGTLFPAINNAPAITVNNKVYSNTKHATNRLAPLEISPSNTGAQTMMQVQPTGNNQPKENMQAFLTINYIISLYGIFPLPS
jgi:microcystin-dependent protein